MALIGLKAAEHRHIGFYVEVLSASISYRGRGRVLSTSLPTLSSGHRIFCIVIMADYPKHGSCRLILPFEESCPNCTGRLHLHLSTSLPSLRHPFDLKRPSFLQLTHTAHSLSCWFLSLLSVVFTSSGCAIPSSAASHNRIFTHHPALFSSNITLDWSA